MTAYTMKAAIPRPPQRVMILAGIGLPFLASSLLGPWADAAQTAAFGIAFLASLATPKPLLVRFAARRASTNPALAARLSKPDVMRALRRLNTIWGVTLTSLAALLIYLAHHISSSQFGPISAALGLGVPTLLGAATFAYVRHSRRATPATS